MRKWQPIQELSKMDNNEVAVISSEEYKYL